MNKKVSDKLIGMMMGMDGAKIKNSAGKISQFLSSEQGKKFIGNMSEADKRAIMDKFMSLDNAKAAEALKNIGSMDTGNINIEDILKKLG